MRFLMAALALSGMAATALAQPPTEVKPETTLSLGVGQVKVYRFDEPVGQVNVITKGVIEATAQSDRQISILGQAEGETQLYVYGANNRNLFDAYVTVTPEAGHVVRIYGHKDNKDFRGYYCTEEACGRADKDLPNHGLPASTSTTITRAAPDGSEISTTKNYQ